MKIKYCLLSVLTIVLSISCKNEVKKSKEVERIEINLKQDYAKFKHFPDTALINKTYFAKIEYASKLDTVELSKEDTRAIFFYVTNQEGTFNDVESIEKVKHEVFGIDEEGVIEFRFSFEKKGVNRFKGIIQDLVILNNYYGDGESRIITRLTDIEKEIFVIDK